MKHKATVLYGDKGWIHSVVYREEERDLELGAGEVPVETDLAQELQHLPLVAHYDGAREEGARVSVPHDDRRLWRVMRAGAMTGSEVGGARAAARRLRTMLPDSPAGVEFPDPLPMAPGDTPVHEFTDVPGLMVRPFQHADLDAAAPITVETGIYPATCPTDPPCCSPPDAHAWCMLAARIDERNVWQLALEFQGRPLQFEFILLDQQQPTVTFTVHLTRERPHWFWREAERPVFEALRARGHKSMLSRTRSDRPDWIAALKRNYKAVELAQLERSAVLEFPLDPATFTGWPSRKTAGPGWEHSAAGVTLRELDPATAPAIDMWLRERWRFVPRGALALRMLQEWTFLDRAALFGVYKDGDLVDVQAVRHRRDTVSGSALLAPLLDSDIRPGIQAGMKLWHQRVGYTETTQFIPEAAWENERMKAHVQGWEVVQRHEQFREPFYEIRIRM